MMMFFLVFAVKNPCKGTCSHLCLLRPGGYTCACPEGIKFLPGSQTECDAGKRKKDRLKMFHTRLKTQSFSYCGCRNEYFTSVNTNRPAVMFFCLFPTIV